MVLCVKAKECNINVFYRTPTGNRSPTDVKALRAWHNVQSCNSTCTNAIYYSTMAIFKQYNNGHHKKNSNITMKYYDCE